MLTLAGCQALYMATGKGLQDPLYKIPPKSRILVFVNRRPGSEMPVDVAPQLGKMINEQLFAFKVADNFVDQGRVADLQRDAKLDQMGIGDLASATQADVAIYVDVLQFRVEAVSDGQVSQGYAAVTVKAVDKAGKRLWPAEADALGHQVEATVDPALTDTASLNAVKAKLTEDLAINVGRIFHAYDKEDIKLSH